MSRAAGGFASAVFPPSGQTGLQYTLKSAAAGAVPAALAAWFALGAAGLLLLDARAGGVMALAALLCALGAYFMSKKQFGGMSGDIAGYLIQTAELAMLAGLILVQKVVAL